jgi:hypothetical protein
MPHYGLANFKFHKFSSSGYLKTPQPGLDLAFGDSVLCSHCTIFGLFILINHYSNFQLLMAIFPDRLSVLFFHASTMNLFGGSSAPIGKGRD